MVSSLVSSWPSSKQDKFNCLVLFLGRLYLCDLSTQKCHQIITVEVALPWPRSPRFYLFGMLNLVPRALVYLVRCGDYF